MRAVVVGLAVVLVAVATVMAFQLAEPQLISGSPAAPGGGGGSPEVGGPRPHEPESVAELSPGRFPKEYGPTSAPDPGLLEVHDGTGYVAYTTFKIVHVTAVDLADGEVRWEREIGFDTPLGSTSMTATDAGLLFVINFQRAAQFSILVDPETGEDLWHASEPALTVSAVVRDNLIVYDRDKDTTSLHPMTGKSPLAGPRWSVAADGGRTSVVFQETAAARDLPRDDGDLTHVVDVGTNPDDGQHIVHAVMYNGAISVRELATGKVLAEGNAGERMVDVVAYEDTVYAYRQTPRTLAAYAATDLSTPKWSVQAPPAKDGSHLDMCAENLLCLTIATARGSTLHAIDATDGKERWQTAEYPGGEPTMAGSAVAVGHGGGTALLDPESGDVITEFAGEKVALPGDGVVIGFDGPEVLLMEPGEREPKSLGEVPDGAMGPGACEWTAELALCAGEEAYQLWRYRG